MYVFTYSSDEASWISSNILYSPAPVEYGHFGYSIATYGTNSVVGAFGENVCDCVLFYYLLKIIFHIGFFVFHRTMQAQFMYTPMMQSTMYGMLAQNLFQVILLLLLNLVFRWLFMRIQ